MPSTQITRDTSGPRPGRRELTLGAAWTMPALAVAAAAPAHAWSPGRPCPSIQPPAAAANNTTATGLTGWTTALGSLAPGSTTYATNWIYQPPTSSVAGAPRWSGWVFQSWRDNLAAAGDTGAADTFNTLSRTFSVESGTRYCFTFQIRGGWGNNEEAAGSSPQYIDISIGGTTLYRSSTRGTGHGGNPAGYPWLNTTASATNNSGTVAFLAPTTACFSYDATSTGPVTLTMRLGLRPRTRTSPVPSGKNWNVGTDDLMVGIPTISCSDLTKACTC